MDYDVKIYELVDTVISWSFSYHFVPFGHVTCATCTHVQFILEDIEQSLGPNGHSSREFFASAYAYTPGEQAGGSSSYDSIF